MNDVDAIPAVPAAEDVVIDRVLNEDRDAIIASGRFTALFSAWQQHRALWGETTDAADDLLMRPALAAAALHLSCRRRDENMAWTFNFQGPAMNLFVTADNTNRRITGRTTTDGVKTADRSRLFVESVRDNGSRFRSVVEFSGRNILGIFDQYARESDQSGARFFAAADDEFLMVLSLPVDDRSWLLDLDLARVQELKLAARKTLDQRTFAFACGCNPQRILNVLLGFWRDRPGELFLEDPRVEVGCPRCGRRWWIRRDDFEANRR